MEKVIRVCDKNGKPLYTRVYAWSDFRQNFLSYQKVQEIKDYIQKKQEEDFEEERNVKARENLKKVLAELEEEYKNKK